MAPIQLEPFDHDPICFGFSWQIEDEDRLARVVAVLVLGYFQHAAQILQVLTTRDPVPPPEMIDAAIAKLRRPVVDALRWHRDGWVFQMISWIAARLAEGGNVVASAPQPRMADKGLDGLIIRLTPTGDDLECIIVCEDKASEDARRTVRDQVWPELEEFETGRRDSEILSQASALLSGRPIPDIETLITRLFWDGRRHYRISVCVSEVHGSPEGRLRLFGGYDTKVPGPNNRRRAETVRIDALRDWMDRFCEAVIAQLEMVRGGGHV